jgi:PadR family transcriptional regulator PadR
MGLYRPPAVGGKLWKSEAFDFPFKSELIRPDSRLRQIMKGDKLGEFEEFALLAVCALKEGTYGVPIQQSMEKFTGRNVSIGAVYAVLARLEDKGFVRSVMGDATPVRGGKRKRLYEPTAAGISAVRDLRRVRERLWQAIESRGRA